MCPGTEKGSILACGDGATIAYHRSSGGNPGVVFLGGYHSDMTGTKATALEAHCRTRGRAFLRFDYFGHGASSGRFEDGTIGRWAADAVHVLDNLTTGPQILVGSSLGGWLMLLVARARRERIAALVGVAAAPDFTEDLVYERLSAEERQALMRQGFLRMGCDDPGGDIVTWRLIEEGRDHLQLRGPIPLSCPVRLLHGMQDREVPFETSLRLADRLESTDVVLTLVKSGNHRLSAEADLRRLCAIVDGLP